VADRSSIEWTEATWNPVTGCDRISAGCENCYALTLAKRLKAMGNPKYQTNGDPRTSGPGFGVAIHEDTLDLPRRWASPRVVFVNSMSDLFHARVPSVFISHVFDVMAATPRHTYQLLTKRPLRLARMARSLPWPENIWVGVSIENQQAAWRLEPLRSVPAAIRFVSAEPLIGSVKLGLDGIDWLIAGGESGYHARPMHAEWVRSLRDDCEAAGTVFFFKLLCTFTRPRKPCRQLFSATFRSVGLGLVLKSRTCSVSGKRIPQSPGAIRREHEFDVVATFRASTIRPDDKVELESPARRAGDREHPGHQSRFAVDRRARPGLVDDQNLVVHTRKSRHCCGVAA
jgi:protein gp37